MAGGVRDPSPPTPRRLCREWTGRPAPPAGHTRARATAGGWVDRQRRQSRRRRQRQRRPRRAVADHADGGVGGTSGSTVGWRRRAPMGPPRARISPARSRPHARGPAGGPTCLETAPPSVRTGPLAPPASPPRTAPSTGGPLHHTRPRGSFHGCTHSLTPRSPDPLAPRIAAPSRTTPRSAPNSTPSRPSHSPPPPLKYARPRTRRPHLHLASHSPPPYPQSPHNSPPRPPADLSH